MENILHQILESLQNFFLNTQWYSLPTIILLGAHSSTNMCWNLFVRQWYSKLSSVVQFWLRKLHFFNSILFTHSTAFWGQSSTTATVGIDWRQFSPLFNRIETYTMIFACSHCFLGHLFGIYILDGGGEQFQTWLEFMTNQTPPSQHFPIIIHKFDFWGWVKIRLEYIQNVENK